MLPYSSSMALSLLALVDLVRTVVVVAGVVDNKEELLLEMVE